MTHQQHTTSPTLLTLAMCWAITMSNKCFASVRDVETSLTLLIIIVGLLLVQTLLIFGLQRNRLKNKAARELLKEHQKQLEEKILERTQSLHEKNTELETAIKNHKAIALQLLDTKRHLQTMINSVPDILVGVSSEGKITYWNTAAYEKTGVAFEKALGINIRLALPQLPIDTEELLTIIKSQQPFIDRHIQRVENDTAVFYDLRIYPLVSAHTSGAVIQLKDVTKRIQLENMMIQSEKMSSLGELAAGIAHEINNPLGIILHNTQNIIRRTSSNLISNIEIAEKINVDLAGVNKYLREREIPHFLESIKEAGERAGKIVTNMLEFSHNNYIEKNWVDLKKLITQSIEFNRNTGFDTEHRMSKIKVATVFSDNFPLVYCSAAELQQVLLNLLRNAYQALVSDGYTQPDELKVSINCYTTESDIIIEISDNGPGMKESVKAHIFEPFFTTKDVGKGTGLGLSVSYFIITEHHKGHISVISHYGFGATFKIRLPKMSDIQHPHSIN